MRPKKKILLIDSDEIRQSLRRFLLSTNGYAVHGASTADEARAIGEQSHPELAIGCLPAGGIDMGALLEELRERDPFLHTLVIAEEMQHTDLPFFDIFADIWISKESYSGETVLARCKLLCARKPGPRKAKPPLSVAQPEPEEARIA